MKTQSPINWALGEHVFRLRIGEAEAMDDLTPRGLADFRYRCREGVERGSLGFSPVKVREVIDCIRLGLIGGGMEGEGAGKLARRAIEEAEFSELVMICWTITTAFFLGKDHDPVGKDQAADPTISPQDG